MYKTKSQTNFVPLIIAMCLERYNATIKESFVNVLDGQIYCTAQVTMTGKYRASVKWW